MTSETLAAVLERSTRPEAEEYQAYGITADTLDEIHKDLAAAAASLRETTARRH